MSARWTAAARQDLHSTVLYLVEHAGPEAAERLLDEVDGAIDVLADGRFDGPLDPLEPGEQVRAWALRNHRLYYRRDGPLVVVLRLFDFRRRPLQGG